MMASVSGFVVCLLSLSVVQGHSDWRVTYTSTEICAIKGSTVEIRCSYTYPSAKSYDKVKEFWFTKMNGDEYVPLKSETNYRDRVQYSCYRKSCTLRIKELRQSDSAVYKFRFTTDHRSGKYTGEPGVTLSVTDPHLQVIPNLSSLQCHSMCHLPPRPSYVWYKNGQEIQTKTTSFYSGHFDPADSFSCALRQHEEFPSPPVCVRGQSCNRVIYTDRSICAFKGSSVNISCTYNSYYHVESKFWFSPERSRQWQNPSQPEDLSKDSKYSGRVQVFETETGRSTLRITDLRDTDSAQYHFKFITWGFEWRNSLPGTTLTVTALQVQVIRVIRVHESYTEAELKCHSSCSPDGRFAFVWFKNGKKISLEEIYYEGHFYPGDNVSCALKGHEGFLSPLVYAPKVTLALVSASADVMEGSSVNLTCTSDANPPANYTWYKKNHGFLSKKQRLIFSSIQSSNTGEYYCTAENELGRRRSENIFIDVKYAPKFPSVSVSPSGEIVEGSSVNLTCSSDAKPAANYTWYKENQKLLRQSTYMYFTSISSWDSGAYNCKCENQYGHVISSSIFIDVQYPPKLPSVSVSPSGEIVEGSSVNLTCSSDAKPAANYTWYKENEDSPKASGQIFTITDFRPENSGNYYCEAQNTRGRHNSTHLTVLTSSMKSAAIGSITTIILVITFLSAFLFFRKKSSLKQLCGPGESPGKNAQVNVGPEYDTVQRESTEQQEDVLYTTVIFSKIREDPLYSNIRTAQLNRDEEEDVDYTVVKSESATPRLSQEAEEDPSELYSTVNKNHRT